jgi:hypothetical protein
MAGVSERGQTRRSKWNRLLQAEKLTVVYSVGSRLWQAAGTFSSHLQDPFLQFSGEATASDLCDILTNTVQKNTRCTGIALPWFISSTTRNGQLVRSWSDTRYRMVETDRSYKWQKIIVIINMHKKKSKHNTSENLYAYPSRLVMST